MGVRAGSLCPSPCSVVLPVPPQPWDRTASFFSYLSGPWATLVSPDGVTLFRGFPQPRGQRGGTPRPGRKPDCHQYRTAQPAGVFAEPLNGQECGPCPSTRGPPDFITSPALHGAHCGPARPVAELLTFTWPPKGLWSRHVDVQPRGHRIEVLSNPGCGVKCEGQNGNWLPVPAWTPSFLWQEGGPQLCAGRGCTEGVGAGRGRV